MTKWYVEDEFEESTVDDIGKKLGKDIVADFSSHVEQEPVETEDESNRWTDWSATMWKQKYKAGKIDKETLVKGLKFVHRANQSDEEIEEDELDFSEL